MRLPCQPLLPRSAAAAEPQELEYEDIIQADSAANASKIKNQSEQIQILEAQL